MPGFGFTPGDGFGSQLVEDDAGVGIAQGGDDRFGGEAGFSQQGGVGGDAGLRQAESGGGTGIFK